MNSWSVNEILTAKVVLPFRPLSIWKSIYLRDQINDVHPEAINAFVKPPRHHIVNFLTHLRILPIQIGLLAGEQVQEIFIRLLVILPG
ncbi:hypothetical protein D3C87_1574200 [compost metagenome]